MTDTTLIQRLRPLADEYASLMDRWKYACAGSQEVADLHATFKARERVAGKAFESGDIAAILDALEQQAAQIEAMRAALEWYADEARSCEKNSKVGNYYAGDAILASVTALALDGGKRADAALSIPVEAVRDVMQESEAA